MITGFEEYTSPLTDYERNDVVPKVAAVLKTRRGSDAAITNKSLREILQCDGMAVSDAKMRAIVNHIRTNHIVKSVLASSKGYYVGESAKEVEEYARSLAERAASITAVRVALLDDLQGSLFF